MTESPLLCELCGSRTAPACPRCKVRLCERHRWAHFADCGVLRTDLLLMVVLRARWHDSSPATR